MINVQVAKDVMFEMEGYITTDGKGFNNWYDAIDHILDKGLEIPKQACKECKGTGLYDYKTEHEQICPYCIGLGRIEEF